MFIPIAGGLAAVILGLLGYAATRPDRFRIERRAHVQAPPDRVFANLVDFKRWRAWSPWEELDPAMRRELSGAASGPGAAYAWEGNRKVGKGRMEITGAEPPRRLVVKLDFIAPFEAHNVTEFLLEPRDGGTEVTWVLTGPNPFMNKVMGIFMNFDKLIGRDFEKGLGRLKKASEAPV
jgi:uncharacterized protein YndB with AHSA1/START domain